MNGNKPDIYYKLDKGLWKTVGVKIRIDQLPSFNQQLNRMNYSTLGELVKDLIVGKITKVTDDQQIEIMKTNLQTNGQITGLSGKPYDFYKQIDFDDFKKYLEDRFQHHNAVCLFNYFEKFSGVFFGLEPDKILFNFNPHKRAWILQAMKKFGDYYFRKYNNREVNQLIKEIIERYELNKNLDMKDKIYLVDPNFIEEKIKKIFEIVGDIGFIARIGLLSALREQEIIYIKEKPICKDGHGCNCENLHQVDCKNGMTVIAIGWARGNKKALATILPTKYWNKFRELEKFDYCDISACHKIMKRDVEISYMTMRKLHYNVMRHRETMAVDEAEVLAGRYRSVSARHYVMHDPDKLAGKYETAWNNFGIDVTKV